MYKLSTQNYIIRLSDGALIPPDSNNPDYKAYLAWATTNTAAIADAPDPKDAIRAQIKAMEDRENLPRVSREFMLGTFEAQFPANALAQHEGYVRLKAFDTQIKALRDQL
jgi:hypothetical protein